MKIGDTICTRNGVDALGRHYWCAQHEPDVVHGPSETEAESWENQRLILLGPDREVDPIIEKLQ